MPGSSVNTKRASFIHRALSAASFASSKRRQPKRLRFLLACDPDHAELLNALVLELRPSLPGCRLECGAIDDAANERSRRHYDAIFVVLYRPDQPLPDQLSRSLLKENWRYHLLSAATNCCRYAVANAGSCCCDGDKVGLTHWQFVDSRHLQNQLGDLMYERARDVQRVPCGSLDIRSRN